MDGGLAALATTAVVVGVLHALLGADHYLPLIALAKSRGWSRRRTTAVTLACGAGHVAGSVLLGALGLWLGWAVGRVSGWETVRGEVGGWLLLGFGVAYLAWGVRHALRNRPHTHWHSHADGTVHSHEHAHAGEHAHLHESAAGDGRRLFAGATAWTLFVVFILGPCEPLIPLLMYPAAAGSVGGVALVAGLFGLATLATMSAAVLTGTWAVSRLPGGAWQRWSHAAAGTVVVLCGLAVQLGL